MIENLMSLYNKLTNTIGINDYNKPKNIQIKIKGYLREFVHGCNNPAIYCYGKHTNMLMYDYMYELKKVKYVVDNNCKKKDAGFVIVTADKIDEHNIDGVIISTFKYKDEIINDLRITRPHIKILDLYEKLKCDGIILGDAYYNYGHPYQHYHKINILRQEVDVLGNESVLRALLEEYIEIKDFRLAKKAAERIVQITNKKDDIYIMGLIDDIYNKEMSLLRRLNKEHILMMCIDGLRRDDLTTEKMPALYKTTKEKSCIFANAYSYSTSTFESLVPSYSGGKERAGEVNVVSGENCEFIKRAKEDKRKIRFYTDSFDYVSDEDIVYWRDDATCTQKIWKFIIDASGDEKGLYYIHVLYESHYSFPNPYTSSDMICEGSAMLFDFLPKNGGALRTDYTKQHDDAIRYLDDTLSPFYDNISMSFLIFADHGNILLPYSQEMHNLPPNVFTCHEDWLRIPLVVSYPACSIGIENRLVSLMDINDIIGSMIDSEEIVIKERRYVEFARSEIYNPDFKCLYKLCNQEYQLLAFIGYIFSEGYKLIKYANDKVELYDDNDNAIIDDELEKNMLSIIGGDIR